MFFTSPTVSLSYLFLYQYLLNYFPIREIYQLTIERVQDSVQKWVNLALLRIACIFKLVHRYQ